MRNLVPSPSGPAEAQRMDVGLLRAVIASLARRIRAPHDPLGEERIKRHAQTLRAMHSVRPQGRDATASRMGRYGCWISAVS